MGVLPDGASLDGDVYHVLLAVPAFHSGRQGRRHGSAGGCHRTAGETAGKWQFPPSTLADKADDMAQQEAAIALLERQQVTD